MNVLLHVIQFDLSPRAGNRFVCRFEVLESSSGHTNAFCELQLSPTHLIIKRSDNTSDSMEKYARNWIVTTRYQNGCLIQQGTSGNIELDFHDQRQRDLAVLRIRQIIDSLSDNLPSECVVASDDEHHEMK